MDERLFPIFECQNIECKTDADNGKTRNKHHDHPSDPNIPGKKLQFKRKKGKHKNGNTQTVTHLQSSDIEAIQEQRIEKTKKTDQAHTIHKRIFKISPHNHTPNFCLISETYALETRIFSPFKSVAIRRLFSAGLMLRILLRLAIAVLEIRANLEFCRLSSIL